MENDLIFEDLGEKERILLLKAFDFDVDSKGFVLTPSKQRIKSKEDPNRFIEAKFALLAPGSLEVIDGTPTAIAEFLRNREKKND